VAGDTQEARSRVQMVRYLTQEREEKQKKRKGTAAVCNKE
jgi:hypothetical protein